MEIQTPEWILKKIRTHNPTVCPGKLLCSFVPSSLTPPGPGGHETLKAEGHIFGQGWVPQLVKEIISPSFLQTLRIGVRILERSHLFQLWVITRPQVGDLS